MLFPHGTSPGAACDRLEMNGNPLVSTNSGRPGLLLNFGCSPSLGDTFSIVTGLVSFDSAFDGYFEGQSDGTIFAVGCTDLRIDYNPTEIRLTVVPERGALTAMSRRRQFRREDLGIRPQTNDPSGSGA